MNSARLTIYLTRSRLSVTSTRALLCLGSWSLLGLVRDEDVEVVARMDDVDAQVELNRLGKVLTATRRSVSHQSYARAVIELSNVIYWLSSDSPRRPLPSLRRPTHLASLSWLSSPVRCAPILMAEAPDTSADNTGTIAPPRIFCWSTSHALCTVPRKSGHCLGYVCVGKEYYRV
jgi:hypothetical protein